MAILSITTDVVGQIGVKPRRIAILSTDNLTTITTAGYLNGSNNSGYQIEPTDNIVIFYNYNPSLQTGTMGYFTASISNGVVTFTNSFTVATANITTATITTGTITTLNATTIQNSSANMLVNTTGAGKTIRLNSRTESTDTANSLIGFQSKIGRGISAATDIIGGEISPRINDGIALTGSAGIVGLHTDVYLKGTTGDIAGDVRGQQIELVDDTGSSRTVAGNVTHLRIRSNLSCTITGKYSVMRVENEEGAKAMDAFAQFTAGSGCLVETNGTVGGAQTQSIKILKDSTTLYVPLYASVS